jgi:hypothetical protein
LTADFTPDRLASMSKKQFYLGQEILASTVLFGKEYYWMKDGDGTIYLVKIGPTGEPDFS